MPEQGRHKHRRHGPRSHQAVPTNERHDHRRPSDIQSAISNTPGPLLYGLALIVIAFGLTFLIVGSVHTSHCKLQKMLPVWLLVMGIIMMIAGTWKFFVIMRVKKDPFKTISMVEKLVTLVLFLFFIGWFIAGNVWVYKAWGEDPDFGHTWFSNGCDKSIFFLSFVAVITMDGILGILAIGFCFWGVSNIIVRE